MPLFQKRVTAQIRAQQFYPASQPLPFQNYGPVVCHDGEGYYVMSANGRQALTEGDWVVLEPESAGVPFGAYPIKPAVFADLYCQVGE
jgi:hypothetical protein